ncbi:MAG TPA: putative peptidoglycan glycosyltransferase FtsW [Candidatus Paceibacterota bacterium]
MRALKSDRIFFFTVLFITLIGLFILISASMGLLTRSGATFYSVISRQLLLGLGLGFLFLNITSRIPYKYWKKIALPFLLLSFVLAIFVFIPQTGFSYGGARRWIKVGSIFFQPSEILKFSFVVYLAAYLSAKRKNIESLKDGFIPFLGILIFSGALIFLEPDFGTLGVMILTGGLLFLIAGGKAGHFGILILIGLIFLATLFFIKPHARSRITVFFHPVSDTKGSGYQLQQSKIAIGSGGLFGKGFGMSAQKFNYLPEPIGDSIFAVYGEEFGFIGVITLVGLFLFFAHRGLKISRESPEVFSRLLGSGIVILITSQAFINIGSMVGIVPLTGLPMTFVSQGGTALALALAESGVLINISKYQR